MKIVYGPQNTYHIEWVPHEQHNAKSNNNKNNNNIHKIYKIYGRTPFSAAFRKYSIYFVTENSKSKQFRLKYVCEWTNWTE